MVYNNLTAKHTNQFNTSQLNKTRKDGGGKGNREKIRRSVRRLDRHPLMTIQFHPNWIHEFTTTCNV